MKLSEFKQLIKQSITEFNDPDYLDLMKKADDTGRGYTERDEFRNQAWDLKAAKLGAMTPEEEKMVADYEKEQDAKHALDKEEPMEEAMVSPDNRVAYLVNALDHVWNMGKGNNPIDFRDMAQSLVNDMFDEETMEESIEEVIRKTEVMIESWSKKKS